MSGWHGWKVRTILYRARRIVITANYLALLEDACRTAFDRTAGTRTGALKRKVYRQ